MTLLSQTSLTPLVNANASKRATLLSILFKSQIGAKRNALTFAISLYEQTQLHCLRQTGIKPNANTSADNPNAQISLHCSRLTGIKPNANTSADNPNAQT
jgi:hypothetical protein